MVDHATAKVARDHVFKAIEEISMSLQLIEGRFPEATYNQMKRAAGIAIGTLDFDYLCRIFELFPDLDEVGQAEGIDHLGRGKSPSS